jgi:hypothetical protein
VAIIITRSLMLHLVVTPDEEIRHRQPVLRGQRLFVQEDYDHDDGYDWLAPLEGGLMPLPPDAWKIDAALMN